MTRFSKRRYLGALLAASAACLFLAVVASLGLPSSTPASATPASADTSAAPHPRTYGWTPPPAESASPGFQSSWRPGRLEVAFLDVGQGDGIGIRCPDGRIVLIDAGVFPAPTRQYLNAVETTVVHALVLTHPHLDHIGGARAVLEENRVERVYDCGYIHTTRVYADLLRAIEADSRIDYYQPRAGDVLDWGRDLRVEVVHPDTNTHEDINDNSIVLRITFGDVSFLFTGDAEAKAEQVMLRRGRRSLASTVLKVGHHGSTSSTTEAFVTAVAPRVAVISCGTGNSYGHPRAAVLERLRRFGVRTLRTDTDGWVSIVTDGRTSTLRTAQGSTTSF